VQRDWIQIRRCRNRWSLPQSAEIVPPEYVDHCLWGSTAGLGAGAGAVAAADIAAGVTRGRPRRHCTCAASAPADVSGLVAPASPLQSPVSSRGLFSFSRLEQTQVGSRLRITNNKQVWQCGPGGIALRERVNSKKQGLFSFHVLGTTRRNYKTRANFTGL
jgi:hypothetical protein